VLSHSPALQRSRFQQADVVVAAAVPLQVVVVVARPPTPTRVERLDA
jgi:hypothetical protein